MLLLSNNLYSQEMHLIKPAGGEKYSTNNAYNIKWKASENISHIKIEIWDLKENEWSILADSVENTGEYSWLVPYDLINFRGKIKISDVANFTNYSMSKALFFTNSSSMKKSEQIENNEIRNISIFPNPVSDILNIQNVEIDAIRSISIFNNLSNLEQSITSGFNSINVSDLSAGVYFLQIEYINGESEVHKFIKI
jgi:hypothetical protein